MNARWRENPIVLQFLLGCLLFLFLSTVSYLIGLIQPAISGLALFASANSTRTSIALTSQALYGPFPTATGPTSTPSWTPSMTPTPTLTPSNTPTPTPIRYFIDTSTPRTLIPNIELTSTGAPPTQAPRPTSTSVQATHPPQQPTSHAGKPTKTAKPHKPTKTPRRVIPIGDCLYFGSCYDFVPDYALRHREMSILGPIKTAI